MLKNVWTGSLPHTGERIGNEWSGERSPVFKENWEEEERQLETRQEKGECMRSYKLREGEGLKWTQKSTSCFSWNLSVFVISNLKTRWKSIHIHTQMWEGWNDLAHENNWTTIGGPFMLVSVLEFKYLQGY